MFAFIFSVIMVFVVVFLLLHRRCKTCKKWKDEIEITNGKCISCWVKE